MFLYISKIISCGKRPAKPKEEQMAIKLDRYSLTNERLFSENEQLKAYIEEVRNAYDCVKVENIKMKIKSGDDRNSYVYEINRLKMQVKGQNEHHRDEIKVHEFICDQVKSQIKAEYKNHRNKIKAHELKFYQLKDQIKVEELEKNRLKIQMEAEKEDHLKKIKLLLLDNNNLRQQQTPKVSAYYEEDLLEESETNDNVTPERYCVRYQKFTFELDL